MSTNAECTLIPDGKKFELLPGRSILESAEQAGIKLPFGCRAGVCGTCFVTVHAGMDYFPPPSPIELDTLQKINKLGEGRLACRIRSLTGPVTIQKKI